VDFRQKQGYVKGSYTVIDCGFPVI